MKKISPFLIAGVMFMFFSCKKDQTQYGNIIVKLTDSPGPYQKVNVDIQQVSIHLVPSSSSPAQWINLTTSAGVYDLLTLQNGIDSTLVKANQLPAGKITEMRLVLGTKNTVVINNMSYSLTVPSGTDTGIKIPGPIAVTANATLQVKIDFNANKSVVDAGNQTYQLKPVIQTL